MGLQRVYGEFENKNVGVVAVSMDGVLDAFNMITLVNSEFPILLDTQGTVIRKYGLYNLLGDGVSGPAVFILGKNDDGNKFEIKWRHISKDAADLPSGNDIILQLSNLGF